MNARVSDAVGTFVLVMLVAIASSHAQAGTTVTQDDYAAANGGNTVRALSGNATLGVDGQLTAGNDGLNDTSYMRIVTNVGSVSGFVTSEATVSGNSTRVTIDFDVRCMNGTATPADGMSVALLNYANNATGVVTWATGEVPSVPGALGIGFNVYNGNAGGTTVNVYYNSVVVGSAVTTSGAPLNAPLYKGAGKTNTEAYDHVQVDADLAAGTVSVIMKIGAAAPVTVIDKRPVPGLAPYRWRVGFGARTGGSNAIFDIDNLVARGLSSPTMAVGAVTVPEDGVSNVNITTTDPEGGPFTYTILTNPTNGALTGTAPTLVYRPNANYSGSDSITVRATDADGNSSNLTIPITVSVVDDGPPQLVDDTVVTTFQVPVTFPVLTNDTINDPPFTLAIATQPLHGSVVLNGDNTITYTPANGYAGPDSFTYRVTDSDLDATTATVNIDIQATIPVINSPLMVSAITSLPFSYRIMAAGAPTITYSAAPLPPGITLVGDTLQGTIQPGSYLVTITATNSAGFDMESLVINALQSQPNVDTDNDGYTDEMEIALGSNPTDATSNPFSVLKNAAGGAPAGAPNTFPAKSDPFFLTRQGVSAKLSFKSLDPLRDSLSLNGTLPVPPGFSAPLQPVVVTIGGATVSGVLDLNGNYTSTNKAVKIKIAKNKAALTGGNLRISMKANGFFSDALADEGFVNADIRNAMSQVQVYVIVGGQYYGATIDAKYTARQGRSGSAKGGRN